MHVRAFLRSQSTLIDTHIIICCNFALILNYDARMYIEQKSSEYLIYRLWQALAKAYNFLA